MLITYRYLKPSACYYSSQPLRHALLHVLHTYCDTYVRNHNFWPFDFRVDFKCSESWLTCFMKRHGFFLRLDNHSGPIFSNYRAWIDAMRSIVMRYKHKDLFHLDELAMYSDISSMLEDDESDPLLKKAIVLMCCNVSGTEKLPLLICGPYPAVIANGSYVHSHSDDASINDTLFREWLNHMNDRMSESNQKILLLLHRDRVSDLEVSNVRRIFFPDAFLPLLRPLKRDIFYLVKMIRSKYVCQNRSIMSILR